MQHSHLRPHTLVPLAILDLSSTDAGNDRQEADGNTDGHPKDNVVKDNRIWSRADEVLRITEADNNKFFVSSTDVVASRPSACEVYLVYRYTNIAQSVL